MDDRLYELVERLGAVLGAASRSAAADAGLQPVHVRILDYLSRCNRFSDTPAAVTAYLGSTKGTVSQSLNLLEREGLVERVPDPDDGRVVHLRVTRRARQVLSECWPPPEWRAAAKHLGAEHTREAERALDELLGVLQRDGRTFGLCGTCRHLRREPEGRHRCGLNGAPLPARALARICWEHEPAA